MMYSIGLLGVIGHWFRAALSGQVTWNLAKYLFVEQAGRSTSMIFGYSLAIYALMQAGAFDMLRIEYITEAWSNDLLYKPFLHAIIEAISAGYMCDSALNKGSTSNVKDQNTGADPATK